MQTRAKLLRCRQLHLWIAPIADHLHWAHIHRWTTGVSLPENEIISVCDVWCACEYWQWHWLSSLIQLSINRADWQSVCMLSSTRPFECTWAQSADCRTTFKKQKGRMHFYVHWVCSCAEHRFGFCVLVHHFFPLLCQSSLPASDAHSHWYSLFWLFTFFPIPLFVSPFLLLFSSECLSLSFGAIFVNHCTTALYYHLNDTAGRRKLSTREGKSFFSKEKKLSFFHFSLLS